MSVMHWKLATASLAPNGASANQGKEVIISDPQPAASYNPRGNSLRDCLSKCLHITKIPSPTVRLAVAVTCTPVFVPQRNMHRIKSRHQRVSEISANGDELSRGWGLTLLPVTMAVSFGRFMVICCFFLLVLSKANKQKSTGATTLFEINT